MNIKLVFEVVYELKHFSHKKFSSKIHHFGCEPHDKFPTEPLSGCAAPVVGFAKRRKTSSP